MLQRTTAPAGRTLVIRIPADLNTRLQALADREANSISAVVRRLLAAAVSREQTSSAGGR